MTSGEAWSQRSRKWTAESVSPAAPGRGDPWQCFCLRYSGESVHDTAGDAGVAHV
ncbi:hypothetical protein NDU88_005427 [Pleurodeles waltl]|uniref:Uncharacterized protein n=1 Tax=Pleurodeles waltl TaxID=8319 RepID=A0AAV7L4U3_PLEWA|nr:hypothetical protein NDU88_005427 [Pleurodeles waltl]